ncbi:MAG TPA: ATP-binding cassette domain-containing protein [Patescibacteria group bacterium]|nr:ATP-binding cassette domain-containing protein [Patescibacteria group bacterium]
MIIIKIRNLRKKFGRTAAVENFSADIFNNTIVGFVGPNGSGKTTVINLLTGVVPFDRGEIYINDTKVLDKDKLINSYLFDISRTYQDTRVFDQMSVLENVLIVLNKRNFLKSLFEIKNTFSSNKAEEALRRVSLWGKRNTLAGELSYGQRKLLELARVLAMNTKICIFDEPFAGLFPETRSKVSELISDLKANGKTVILIEHDMDQIVKLADYVLVMNAGRLIVKGAPSNTLSRNDVLDIYLGRD